MMQWKEDKQQNKLFYFILLHIMLKLNEVWFHAAFYILDILLLVITKKSPNFLYTPLFKIFTVLQNFSILNKCCYLELFYLSD